MPDAYLQVTGIQAARDYLFPVYLDIQRRLRLLAVWKIDIPKEIVAKDIGNAYEPLGIYTFWTDYIINSGALHAQSSGKFGVTHATLPYASVNQFSYMYIPEIRVHKKVWLSVSWT